MACVDVEKFGKNASVVLRRDAPLPFLPIEAHGTGYFVSTSPVAEAPTSHDDHKKVTDGTHAATTNNSRGKTNMKLHIKILSTSALLLASLSNAHAGPGGSFSFNVTSISGAPTGDVTMTGGGFFDAAGGVVKGHGHFRCQSDINQGPLSGLRAGEGARWEAIALLPSSGFRCGTPDEVTKTAVSDDNTVVMTVAFFRQGDGTTPSFTTNVFVSADDEGSDIPGNQNVWIQGLGCGDANVHFGR